MQKFFCDNCGTKVDKNCSKCPNCGRFFQSVKCPVCRFVGSPEDFINGCPSCGYAEEKKTKKRNKPIASKKKKQNFSVFSDRIYKILLPSLIVIFLFLVFILFKTGWN